MFEKEEVSLKSAKVNHRYLVKKVGGNGALRRRIMDMGIVKGTMIYVRKLAPLGDPIQINLRGYELTLRREDAKNIIVEDLGLHKKEEVR
ncbi:MAG: ferrous iron transport protein A [Finegoldia sp.]|nr:ferrous iron transport protein A [Finegoldia sp.]